MVTLTDHMSEAAWQQRITEYADLRGVRWHHEVDSRKSKAGFPDLVLAGPGGVVFLELKKQTGRISDAQHAWLDALRGAGAAAFVARPSDWDDLVRPLIDQLARRRP